MTADIPEFIEDMANLLTLVLAYDVSIRCIGISVVTNIACARVDIFDHYEITVS
jgi:hypothetical protein